MTRYVKPHGKRKPINAWRCGTWYDVPGTLAWLDEVMAYAEYERRK
jgi:hypothetical protein